MSYFAGKTGNDTLIGGRRNDFMYGYAGDDHLVGGLGDDRLDGGTGANTLDGGAGNDTYLVNGNELSTKIFDVSGLDRIVLLASSGRYAGGNTIDISTFSDTECVEGLIASSISDATQNLTIIGNSIANILYGGSGADTIYGRDGNDNVGGGKGNDVLYAGNGNDLLYGGTENDTLYGEAGNDTLFGDANNDYLMGGAGDDLLNGGIGDDTLFGGAGVNRLLGGDGNDTYLVDGITTTNTISESKIGADSIKLIADSNGNFAGGTSYALNVTFVETLDASNITSSDMTLIGSSQNDTLIGGLRNNILNGGAGNDTYLVSGKEASYSIIDSAGSDTIKLAADASGYFNGQTQSSLSIASYTNIENINTSLITKTNMTLIGNGLNNNLTGGAGNDYIDGADGSDIINGGAGNDTLSGGAGTNKLYGGLGNDTYLISGFEQGKLSLNEKLNEGIDTIKLLADASGAYHGTPLFKMTDFATIENFDGSAIQTTKLSVLGNILDNYIIGGAANDTFSSGSGNDTLFGGMGENKLHGGYGSDTYLIDGRASKTEIAELAIKNLDIDTIKLTANYSGANTVLMDSFCVTAATVENLDGTALTTNGIRLVGNDLDNLILGGSTNDTLFGGLGKNTLNGGLGNDTYEIDSHETSTVVIDAGGSDTVYLVADQNGVFAGGDLYSIAIPAFGSMIENLDGTGITASNMTLIGNTLNNLLLGGTLDDSLLGGNGNDSLFGGKGSNILNGGSGNDAYMLDALETATTIIDVSGTDSIALVKDSNGAFAGGSSFTIDNPDWNSFIENLDASAITSLGMTLTGNNLDNLITGGASDDKLMGGVGNDSLFGGLGSNVLDGGVGNDTYILDGKETSTVLVDSSGVDTISLVKAANGTFAGGATYTLNNPSFNSFIENIDASAITSMAMILSGNDLNNRITGGANNDTLSGGLGSNILDGANGNDTYLIDGLETATSIIDANGTDTIKLVQNAGGAFVGGASFAIDGVCAVVNKVENLDASLITATNLTLIGNSLNNLITGGAGNDNLQGNLGNDTLDGGLGNNILNGGGGNDTYNISGLEAGTSIIDASGVDTIKLVRSATGTFVGSSTFSVDDFSAYLGTIENLDASAISTTNMTLNGNALNNSLKGGAGMDTLFGGLGSNVLDGGTGNDVYLLDGNEATTSITDASGVDTIRLVQSGTGTFAGNFAITIDALCSTANRVENLDASAITTSNLVLTGNNLNNVITGGAGNDTINGGLGSNVLNGGAGDDTYFVAGTETSTSISDVSGVDTVKLLDNVNGAFAGSATVSIDSFSVTVNKLENLDASSISSTNLSLYGNNLNNTITGGQGSDYIYAGLGNDSLIGGLGDDSYFVDTLSFSLTENALQGRDTIVLGSAYSSGNVNLANYAYIEDLDGSAVSVGMEFLGNDENNLLIGGSGSDTLAGGLGNDMLLGNAGNDTYQFDSVSAGQDIVAATEAGEVINFTSADCITELLFYTDDVGNFFIDHTYGGIGTNVVGVLAGSYDANTTIKVGNDASAQSILLDTIIQQLAATGTAGLDSVQISNLSAETEAAQVAALSTAWSV